ncbi:MAG: regulatory protein RecX [Oscillibacter sp.]|nr:regulatory protein RecX [Oscillibacter sp.]
MRIERIEPSPHKKGQVLVFLDSGACLKVTEQELLDFSLHAGDELDAAALSRLREAAGVSNIKAKAAELVSKKAMSRRELERKLREKGASEEEIAEAVGLLETMGALNDADYAAALARQYAAKGYGPAKIRSKLYEKGVPRELWEDAMADLPDDGGQIDAYLRRKLVGVALDEREKRKLTASLLRKGFSWEDVRAGWNRVGQELEG